MNDPNECKFCGKPTGVLPLVGGVEVCAHCGDILLPFINAVDKARRDGYDDGYNDGHESGYDEGCEDSE
ncbi:MAG TPA: hypothetical protein VIV60_00805 [Polyangiaceae bacterium]